jgi:dihydrolipoamide dehydrogenase
MYDLTIIGAGWAGFNAALRAKSLGLKVALIEEAFIGGTCLNSGCIPTKTLVQSAKILEVARKAGSFGIEIAAEPKVNFAQIQSRKNRIIQQLAKAMESRLSGIDYFTGHGQALDNQRFKVNGRDFQTKFFLLAGGARPFELPGFAFDGKKIISSEEALNLSKAPESLFNFGLKGSSCGDYRPAFARSRS